MKLSPRFTETLDQRTFVEDLSRVKNTGIGSYLDEKYALVDYDSAWYQGNQIVFVESENMLSADGPWNELHPLFDQTVYVNTSSHIAPVTALTKHEDISYLVQRQEFDIGVDKTKPRVLLESESCERACDWTQNHLSVRLCFSKPVDMVDEFLQVLRKTSQLEKVSLVEF